MFEEDISYSPPLFVQLPDEILLKIVTLVAPKDRKNLSGTCVRFYNFCKDARFIHHSINLRHLIECKFTFLCGFVPVTCIIINCDEHLDHLNSILFDVRPDTLSFVTTIRLVNFSCRSQWKLTDLVGYFPTVTKLEFDSLTLLDEELTMDSRNRALGGGQALRHLLSKADCWEDSLMLWSHNDDDLQTKLKNIKEITFESNCKNYRLWIAVQRLICAIKNLKTIFLRDVTVLKYFYLNEEFLSKSFGIQLPYLHLVDLLYNARNYRFDKLINVKFHIETMVVIYLDHHIESSFTESFGDWRHVIQVLGDRISKINLLVFACSFKLLDFAPFLSAVEQIDFTSLQLYVSSYARNNLRQSIWTDRQQLFGDSLRSLKQIIVPFMPGDDRYSDFDHLHENLWNLVRAARSLETIKTTSSFVKILKDINSPILSKVKHLHVSWGGLKVVLSKRQYKKRLNN